MISASIYAQSIFEIAREDNFEKFLKELQLLDGILLENKKIYGVFLSLNVDYDTKLKLIDDFFKKDFNKNIVNFLKFTVEKKDFSKVGQILNKTIKMIQKELNFCEGIIFSPHEISSSHITKITKIMENKLKKKVFLRNHIDKSLIGGLKIVINKKIYDSSISFYLKKLHKEIEERLEK